jgi:hypothetical protein
MKKNSKKILIYLKTSFSLMMTIKEKKSTNIIPKDSEKNKIKQLNLSLMTKVTMMMEMLFQKKRKMMTIS